MKQLTATCLLIFSIAFQSQAQNKPFITYGALVGQEAHTFDVTYGPSRTLGTFDEKNLFFGIYAKYNKKLLNRIYGYSGLGYLHYKSNVYRIYNLRFFNNYTAILAYTNNSKYHLLGVPIGIDCKAINGKKFSVLLGTSLNFNFSFLQSYGLNDFDPHTKLRFYFFGYSHQVSLALRHSIFKNKFIEIRPHITTVETWRKDEILYEDNSRYYQIKSPFYGISLAYGVQL